MEGDQGARRSSYEGFGGVGWRFESIRSRTRRICLNEGVFCFNSQWNYLSNLFLFGLCTLVHHVRTRIVSPIAKARRTMLYLYAHCARREKEKSRHRKVASPQRSSDLPAL